MACHSTKRMKWLRESVLPARGRTVAAAALTAMAAATGVVATATAAPVPDKPSATSEGDPAAVRAQIAALYRQAERLTQSYDADQEQVADLTLAVQRSQTALEAAQVDFEREQVDLGAMAADRYRADGVDERLALMLAGNPDTFLGNEAMAARITDEQLGRVAQAVETRRRLLELRHAAADELVQLAATRDAVAQARIDVAGELRKAQTLLSTLTAPQRAAVAQSDLGADPSPGFTPEQPDPTELEHTAPPPSDRVRVAIDAALADLGKPYVFGAEGPDAFDCSGLIQRVWRQAGVVLPRTSSEQAGAGEQVPLSRIQPGDLVIYYAGRSHIGMYLGGGKIIHAPHPGAKVRISPLMSMPVNMVVRV